MGWLPDSVGTWNVWPLIVTVGVVISAPVVVVVRTASGGLALFCAGELPHDASAKAPNVPARGSDAIRNHACARPRGCVVKGCFVKRIATFYRVAGSSRMRFSNHTRAQA